MVLPPDVRAEQIVERGDRPPPGNRVCHLQPLRMLIEHRIDDVDEGLVTVEEAVTAGQQVPLQPALALMLRQHLHHLPVWREVIVGRQRLGVPGTVGRLEHRRETVRGGLVGAEEAEPVGVRPDHVTQEAAEHPRRLGERRPRSRHLDRVSAEVGQGQILEQQAAVRVRVRAHPPVALRRQRRQLRRERPLLVEQLLRAVAPKPRLELRQMLGVRAHLGDRHLVCPPRPFDGQPVDRLRPGPALRRAQHDERPARPCGAPVDARRPLDRRDLLDDRVEHLGHPPMHRGRLVAVHPVHRVTAALQQRGQLVVADPGEHGRVRDLVAVQVQDRQHRAVARRVEELVCVPAGRERAGLRLAVADDAEHEQVGVVERRSVGVREGVAELAALVDRAGRLRCHMRRDPAGERELPEQPAQTVLVARHLGVDLCVRALEVGVRDRRRAAVAGPDHVDRVQIPVADHPVRMRVDEVQPRRRPPVPEQPGLHLARLQRLAQQRVVEQVDLSDRHVVRRPPVPVKQLQLVPAGLSSHAPPLRLATHVVVRTAHFDLRVRAARAVSPGEGLCQRPEGEMSRSASSGPQLPGS